ncbi:MAG: folate family ECF transporter S component [Oscillospiraceae bacterium]|nr:folate family ECF transporter S component [Oscillospiraceae bacterium]
MTFFANFKRSASELKNLRTLCVTSMLIALDLVLKSVTINVTESMKITFAFVALASIGMLFGPVVSLLAGTVTDVIGFFIAKQSGAFNPMFTAVEAIGAMIYGIILYNLRFSDAEALGGKFVSKNDVKQIFRIISAKVAVVVVCNLILTPLALIATNSMNAGALVYAPTLAAYPARLLKNAIQCPVDCVLLLAVLPIVSKAYYRVFKSRISAA